MKIKGHEDLAGLPTGLVSLPRPEGKSIVLRVRALPIGFDDEAEKICPSPVPSWTYVTNAKGAVIRDPSGQPMRQEDRGPKFQAEEGKANGYHMMFYIWKSLDGFGEVEFDAKAPKGGPDKAFLDKIKDEMSAWGITPGDMKLLVDKILEISNIREKDIERVAQDFFGMTGPAKS